MPDRRAPTQGVHAGYCDAVPSPPFPLETASWARRLGALLVDWLACYFIVLLVLGPANVVGGARAAEANLWITLLFLAESTLLTATLGGSFGKLVTRLRVVTTDGRPFVTPWKALVRTILVLLVIPPVVFRPDGRGLHDMAVGSGTVTLRTLRTARGQA